VTACAICGSDLHIYGGIIPQMKKGETCEGLQFPRTREFEHVKTPESKSNGSAPGDIADRTAWASRWAVSIAALLTQRQVAQSTTAKAEPCLVSSRISAPRWLMPATE
jgi:hypothetical protein